MVIYMDATNSIPVIISKKFSVNDFSFSESFTQLRLINFSFKRAREY
jgi:hypothetical protein